MAASTFRSPPLLKKDFSTVDSQDDVKDLVVLAAPCLLRAVRFTSSSASARFLQLFNKTTAASDGDVPAVVSLPADGSLAEWQPDEPIYFSTGLYACSSSTRKTRTLTGAADLWVSFDIVPG